MDAVEFFRKFGFGEAKRLLKDARGCSSVSLYSGKYEFNTEDLKRLVESHELVEKCGGLSSAKNLSGDDLYCFFKQPFIPTFSDIAQAIADVESCQC